MSAPYPDIPPNYQTVRKLGTYDRDCLVIELCTLGQLPPGRLAALEDAIGVAIAKFQDVEKHRIVRSDNFNLELSRALRL